MRNEIDALYYTIKAMRALVPDAKINIAFKNTGEFDYSGISIENGHEMPTEEQILNKIDELYDADILYANNTKYQKDRQKEYPPIGDQLDMLWHAIDDNSLDKNSNFYLTLKQVKDNYPKPE